MQRHFHHGLLGRPAPSVQRALEPADVRQRELAVHPAERPPATPELLLAGDRGGFVEAVEVSHLMPDDRGQGEAIDGAAVFRLSIRLSLSHHDHRRYSRQHEGFELLDPFPCRSIEGIEVDHHDPLGGRPEQVEHRSQSIRSDAPSTTVAPIRCLTGSRTPRDAAAASWGNAMATSTAKTTATALVTMAATVAADRRYLNAGCVTWPHETLTKCLASLK